MDIDAVVVGLLAILDLAVFVHLRIRHHRRARVDRMYRHLALMLRRDPAFLG